MTLLKERGRLDDNDARAFLLSNTAEERIEALWIFMLDRLLALGFNESGATSLGELAFLIAHRSASGRRRSRPFFPFSAAQPR